MQKLIILLTAILGCVASSCYAQSHNSFWGKIGESDTLILRQHVVVDFKRFRTVTQEVTFPDHGYIINRQITSIRAIDQKTDGTGAHASIKAGGIKSNHTVIQFKSGRGHGINFYLEIYVE